MSDNSVDRLVRDADPARPGIAERLDPEGRELLAEIVSQPVRRGHFRWYGGALAAAAVLAVALAVPTVLPSHPAGPGPAAPSQPGPGIANTPVGYAAAVQRSADENPRLLIDQPGWTTHSVYGFADRSGSIRYAKDGRELEITWYPDKSYPDYYVDRLDVSKPQPVQVAGRPGSVFTYSGTDFAVMLKPYRGTFVEFRTTGVWSRAGFDAVIADVVQVDVRKWLTSLPPEVVVPDRADAAAAEVLDGVPLPPGYSSGFPARLGVNDRDQFVIQLTGLVGCGWMDEWQRAKKSGNQADVARAADALRSSHDWPALTEMQGRGHWSDTFWETADATVAGNPPERYGDAIGCWQF